MKPCHVCGEPAHGRRSTMGFACAHNHLAKKGQCRSCRRYSCPAHTRAQPVDDDTGVLGNVYFCTACLADFEGRRKARAARLRALPLVGPALAWLSLCCTDPGTRELYDWERGE